MKKAIKMIAGACAAAVVCAGGLLYYNLSRQNVRHTSATFVMDAVADQKVYGPNGEKAIAAAEQAFREMENRLSVYKEGRVCHSATRLISTAWTKLTRSKT